MKKQIDNGTLKDKKIIVLGGSSGLGFATAKLAASEGAKVTIVSSNMERVNKALSRLPTNCQGYAVDLSLEEKIRQFFDNKGHFDHLVYTAGENITSNLVTETDIQAARNFFTLRFWSAMAVIKYGSGKINPGGSISLMSGNFGQRPAAGYSLGASICGAMDAFTRAMAIELAPLRVNNVAAGVIRTSLWDNLTEADRAGFYQSLEGKLLLKRVGEAEDIAKAFIYLMTQSYTTGQSIIVDGGAVLV